MPAAARALSATGAARPLKGIAAMIAGMAVLTLSDAISKQPNPLDPVARRFQGGQFVTVDYTPIEQRPVRSPASDD